MQIVLIGNRVVAHGENCFLCMGGTVICEETGKAFSNATVAEVDAIPADLDTVGYEYRAGVFVPCAPYGVGAGALMVACEECGTPKRSKVTADADGGLNVPGYLKGGKVGDEVSSALGLTDATVDEALGKLGNLYAYVWLRRTLAASELGESTKRSICNTRSTSETTEIKYSSRVDVGADGEPFLVEPNTVKISYSNATTTATVLIGNYYQHNNEIFYAFPEATISKNTISSSYFVYLSLSAPVVSVSPAGEWEVLASFNRNAYPDSGIIDGYEYVYSGVPFDNVALLPVKNAKIETGFYTGTGTYGSSNPNSLTFSFEPKLIIIYDVPNSDDGGSYKFAPAVLIAGRNGVTTYSSTNNAWHRIDATWTGNFVSWYNTQNVEGQRNVSGDIYAYVAIG